MQSGFDFMDESEFEQIVYSLGQDVIADSMNIGKDNIKYCSDCQVDMEFSQQTQSSYICPKCGQISEVLGNEFNDVGSMSRDSYSTSSRSATRLKVSGPHSYSFQRKLVSCTTEYSKTQKYETLCQLKKYMHQYQGPKIPSNIVKETASIYSEKIQSFRIQRSDIRLGILGAILYHRCAAAGITRKFKEIADIFGISQTKISKGDKILREMHAENRIDIKFDRNPMKAFIPRYFELLGIDEKYEDFIYDLINFTIKKRIARSSIMSTKCAGAIHILSLKLPLEELTKDKIVQECKICKSTFTKFSNAVLAILNANNRRRRKTKHALVKIFETHGVPVGLIDRYIG